MSLWSSIKRWFGIRSPEEMYQQGKITVDHYLHDAPNKDNVAEHLYALASGGFNRNENDTRFDQGVKDRLDELGYDEDHFTV